MERPWEGKTILIVDDNAVQRAELTRIYRGLGLVPVGEAEDGLEALAFVREKKPDLVSLDIIMPNMDGMECYRNIKNMAPAPLVFFVSALSGEQRVTECYAEDIGLDKFLTKPLSAEVLEGRLAAFFGLRLPPPPGEESDVNPVP